MKAWMFLLFLLANTPVWAATIVATGSFSLPLGTGDLTAGAGSNLPASLTSAGSVFSVNVNNAPLIGSYRVYARVSGTGIPAGVTLSLKRTSDGVSLLPLALISGGTSFITLSSSDTEIFSGELDRDNISLQLRISGLSVAVTPATYQISVILTVTP